MKIKYFIITLAIVLTGIALYRTWVYAKTFSVREIIGHNPFKPDLGVKQSLPAEAIDSKFLVEKHGIHEVILGEEILKNGYLSQRTGEFIYPVRVNPTQAKHLIDLNTAKVKGCQVIEPHQSVTLYACQ